MSPTAVEWSGSKCWARESVYFWQPTKKVRLLSAFAHRTIGEFTALQCQHRVRHEPDKHGLKRADRDGHLGFNFINDL